MILNSKQTWDLHCHSQFSDGKLTLQELFALAVERGVAHLALTDHDTAAGYRAAQQEWIPDALTLYPGAELSCVWRGRALHIVGLGMDVQHEGWRAVEADYVRRREARFDRIVFVLRRAGLQIDEAIIRGLAEPGPPARPHIAEYLVMTEQAKTTATAYKKYLGRGTMGDVKSQWPDLEDAIQRIVRHGGVAILAHPHRYNLTWTKCRELLDDFTAAGGRGLEISCVGMEPNFRSFLIEQAQQRSMWASGGSDFHHPNTAWLKLGYYPAWPNQVDPVSDWLMQRFS